MNKLKWKLKQRNINFKLIHFRVHTLPFLHHIFFLFSMLSASFPRAEMLWSHSFQNIMFAVWINNQIMGWNADPVSRLVLCSLMDKKRNCSWKMKSENDFASAKLEASNGPLGTSISRFQVADAKAPRLNWCTNPKLMRRKYAVIILISLHNERCRSNQLKIFSFR